MFPLVSTIGLARLMIPTFQLEGMSCVLCHEVTVNIWNTDIPHTITQKPNLRHVIIYGLCEFHEPGWSDEHALDLLIRGGK